MHNADEVLRTLTIQLCFTDPRCEDAAIVYLDTVDMHILHIIHTLHIL